jgi:phosphoglycerate dehydrogenase-like enzyme
MRLHTDAFDVLVVEADFVFPEVFEAAPNLRLVGVCRNALNQVDVGAATLFLTREGETPTRWPR